jgi:thiosulfate/3-mercaptopyruvate sulfurtransferase
MKYKIGFILVSIAAASFVKQPESPLADERINSIACNPGLNLQQTIKSSHLSPAEPWTVSQLMAPANLASTINNPKAKKPIIICVGPGALIKGSLDMGPAKEKENLEKLKDALSRLPKDADIVIYCGCCPFEHCPNIRPAFTLLNEMKFTNTHLLNLEHNIKTDWVAKGYPQ